MLLLILILATILAIYPLAHLLLPYLSRKRALSKIPLHTFTDLPDTLSNYITSTRQLHYAGYAKFSKHDLPYRVRTSTGGERIILPIRYLNEIKNASQNVISLPSEMEDLLLMKYTGVPQRTDSGTRVVRKELTRNLGNFVGVMWEECEGGFREHLPLTEEWNIVKPYHIFAMIVATISSRVLVGPGLCRDEGWLRLSIDFSTHAFGAARMLRAGNNYPWSMWFAWWTEPAVAEIRARRREAEELLRPICEERLRRQSDPNWQRPYDGIQWLLDSHGDCGESTEEVMKSLLRLNMAAIHNTTMSVTNALFDLMEYPEYVDCLREEIERVLGEEGGWTKQALTKLRKMDSFMKETLRMNPTTPITGKRKVLHDYRLHDGLLLAKGSHIAFASDAVNRDPEIYSCPDAFHGMRFHDLREWDETKYQFVTATSDYLNWGQGGHACPGQSIVCRNDLFDAWRYLSRVMARLTGAGRFFASNEIKLMLAFVLQQYDFRWKEGESRPESLNIDWNVLPDREKEVEVRRRRMG